MFNAEYINKEYLVMVSNVWIDIRRNRFLNCVRLIALYAHKIFTRIKSCCYSQQRYHVEAVILALP